MDLVADSVDDGVSVEDSVWVGDFVSVWVSVEVDVTVDDWVVLVISSA